MARLALVLALLTGLITAQDSVRTWSRETLFREYQKGNYQVYEIDTHDDATKRCVIVLLEERKAGFRRIQIKPGEPIRYAVDGSSAYVADSTGVERAVAKGPQKLMVRR